MGDPLYGRGRKAKALTPEAKQALEQFDRQALHAVELGFTHPISGDHLLFKSQLSLDFNELLCALEAM